MSKTGVVTKESMLREALTGLLKKINLSELKVIADQADMLDKQVVLPMEVVSSREWISLLFKTNQINASWSFEYDEKEKGYVLNVINIPKQKAVEDVNVKEPTK